MNIYVWRGLMAFLGIAMVVIAFIMAINTIDNSSPFSNVAGHNNLRLVQYNSFVSEDEFSGVVVATEDLGAPQFDISYPNSERVYNVLILTKGGTYCVVLNFHLGRHAKDVFADLTGKDKLFPDTLRQMRASVFTD